MGAYSKDALYFVVSMFVPIGYGETDLIPHDSIWHPLIGWACWAIPVYMLCRMIRHWLTQRQSQAWIKNLVVTVIAGGFLVGAVFALVAFDTRKKNDVQEEVSRNITPTVYPPLTENVMESVFSLKNGSAKTTISSGLMFCGIYQILGQKDGLPIEIGELSSAAVPNASLLLPGDSRSEPCLMIWSQKVDKATCVDMKLWMRYQIEPQKAVTKDVDFRLVGYQSRGGTFNWYPEPTTSEVKYCDYFRRQIAPPS